MRCKSTEFFSIYQIICSNFARMIRKYTRLIGPCAIAASIILFAIHAAFARGNNFVLLSALFLVLAGVALYVTKIKHDSQY